MPELPEVETVRRGIELYALNAEIDSVIVRDPRLRYPVPNDITKLIGETIVALDRRAKYLIIRTLNYQVILHLGMSGAIHVLNSDIAPRKHDHIIIKLNTGKALFYNDPRRFGFLQIYDRGEIPNYFLKLAPEPLSEEFNAEYFYNVLQKRNRVIKSLLMDQSYVVGVGNIYANEVLFLAKISPERVALSLTKKESEILVKMIKMTLIRAIEQGGTTLKDFSNAEGHPGYFSQDLNVYGRKDELCVVCGEKIVKTIIAQRGTFWCKKCQQ